MALDAYIVGVHIIETRRVHDILTRRLGHVRTSGAVALFTSHIPLRNRFRLNVIVDRMATVAERSSRPLHVVIGVESGPPVGAGCDLISPPDLMIRIPLRTKWEIIIAPFREVTLLPPAAIRERYILFREFHQRVRFGEIRDDRVRGAPLDLASCSIDCKRRVARLAGSRTAAQRPSQDVQRWPPIWRGRQTGSSSASSRDTRCRLTPVRPLAGKAHRSGHRTAMNPRGLHLTRGVSPP